jgi:mRNA interferase MazF
MAWIPELRRGDVVWTMFNATRGREQQGQRPAVIVASNNYLESVPNMVIALPVSSVDRGWPHHVRLNGTDLQLSRTGWAMTEQPRAISRDRLARTAGGIDPDCMEEIDQWLRDFLGLH